MKLTGSMFVEDEIAVHDDAASTWPIALCFDGAGSLFVQLTLGQARELWGKLGDALRSVEHDLEADDVPES